MAEEKENKEEQAQEARKSKKLFLIGGLVFLILAGGGGFFLWTRMGGSEGKEVAKKEAEKKAEELSEFVSLDPFVVNLKGREGRYLKVVVNLEVGDKKTAEEIKAKTPLIRDSIIILLSSKEYVDVGSVEGKYKLRDEILARVNRILTEGKVKGVYFTDFVIQ